MGFILLLLGVATLAVALGTRTGASGAPRTYVLDSNLPPAVRDQVLSALATERDPARLETFATALQFQYPMAANALWTRAKELRGGAPSPMPSVPVAPPAPAPAMPQVPVAPAPAPAAPAPSAPAAPPSIPIPFFPGLGIPLPQVQPPAAPAAPAPAPTPAAPAPAAPMPSMGFDVGMPPDVAQAVTNALMTENDPAKLRAFAATLSPKYPIAAGMLTAKANALSPVQPQPAPPAPNAPPAPTPVGPTPVLPLPIPIPPFVPPAPAPGGSAAQFAIVTTHDEGPMGDLKVFSAPDEKSSFIGGAEKNGTVTVLQWNVDGQNKWARIAWGGGKRWGAVTGYTHQAYLKPTTQPPVAPAIGPAPAPAPAAPVPTLVGPAPIPGLPIPLPPGLPIPLPSSPGALPAPAAPLFAKVTTKDSGPSGDLKVFSAPDGKNFIGGAEKDGIVSVLQWNADGQNKWARIAWPGGARWKAVSGFVHQEFLTPTQPAAPPSLVLSRNMSAPQKGAPNAPHA